MQRDMHVKEYDVMLRWQGFLIPLYKHSKTLADYESKDWQGKVLYYSEDMVFDVASSKFYDRILIVHGQNTICSWIDALKVLEKLKAVECRLQSLLLVMKDHSVKDEVLQQVEFSMLLNQFQYPVVGILSQDFDFQPQFWPTSDQLTALLPSVKWEYMMESAQEWSIPQDKYDLQPLTVCVRSMQGRSLAHVDIEWHGKELYVGRMQGGKKHGLGVTIKRSGNKFNGSFLNGMAHGWGVFYNRDGSVFAGEWRYGKQVGPGLSWNVEMIQAAKRFL